MRIKKILTATMIALLAIAMVLVLVACEDNTVNNYSVTLTCDEEQGSVIGGGEYAQGSTVKIRAQEKPGYIFIAWYEGQTLLSENSEYIFVMGDKDLNIRAEFTEDPSFKQLSLTLLDDGTYRIDTVIDKSIAKISIPKYVSAIEKRAFVNCINLTEITVPASVKYIGNGAFYSCISLTSITLPFIGEESDAVDAAFGQIFGANTADDNLFVVPSSLRKVVITGGNKIDSFAFKDCSYLTSISIPNSVAKIGEGAFYGCKSLSDFVIPSGVTTIDDSTFMGCEKLKSVSIPDSVTSIGWYAFAGCQSLKGVTINNVKIIGKNAFYGCNTITSIVIPKSMLEIGADAFNACYALAEVYNLSNLNITVGSTDNGSVALYAEKVHISMSEASYLTEKDGMIFFTNGNKVSLIKYIGDAINVEIPDTVTKIGVNAFYNCKNITSVTIPNSVQSIGINAFNGCSSIESLTLPFIGAEAGGTTNTHLGYLFGAIDIGDNGQYVPQSLKDVVVSNGLTIASNAFYKCNNITSITLPNGITSIGNNAFNGCISLENITIPDAVKSIGESAFADCRSLKSITIPDKLTTISKYAFYNCSGLSNITIPDSVKSIGSSAFSGCNNINSITLPFVGAGLGAQDKTDFGYIFGTKANIPMTLTKVVLTNGNSIAPDAFSGCSYITSITLPNLTSIGANAFSDCNSISTISYNGSVDQWCAISGLGNLMRYGKVKNLFIGGSEIKGSLIIPDTVTNISDYAFYKCTAITNVTIGNSVTNIANGAFYDCINLTAVTISDNVTNIGESAFYNTSLIDLSVPDSVINIGKFAFSNCQKLESVIIGNGATSILSETFSNCQNLLNAKIGNSVTSIDSKAFYNCSNFNSITLGSDLTNIANDALYNCNRLAEVRFNGTVAQWCAITGLSGLNKDNIDKKLYIEGKEIAGELEIPDGVTSISEAAFYDCTGLTSVTVPNSVTSIGQNAFYNCSSLISITLPFIGEKLNNSKNSHFAYIFGAKDYISFTYYLPKSLRNVTITGGKSIGEYAFYGCSSLTSISIPGSVTSIGQSAFYNCSNLEKLVLPNGIEKIFENTFSGCSSLTSISIPDSVTSIGQSAFNDCSGLKSLVLPNGIEKILDNAFYDCNGLVSISIPDSVTNIGQSAFYNCSSLKSLELPKGLGKISGNTFNNCTSLSSISIPDSVTTIGASAFSNCYSLTSITIPKKMSSIDEDAFLDCFVLDEIYNLSSLNFAKGETNHGRIAYYARDIYKSLMESSKLTKTDDAILRAEGDQVTLLKYIGDAENVTIPNNVTSINKYAFYKNNVITSVTISSGVTCIGERAFYDCKNLNEVIFEITNGWFRANNADATSGTSLIVTNSSHNGTWLSHTYSSSYWIRG